MDDLPISKAHREALEARRKFFESRPDLELPKLPDEFGKLSDLGACNALFAQAEENYSQAAGAFLDGNDSAGQAFLNVAGYLNYLGHACIDAEIHKSPFK